MSVPAREKTGAYYNYYTESRHDVEVSSFRTPLNNARPTLFSTSVLKVTFLSHLERHNVFFLFFNPCVSFFFFLSIFWHINLRLNYPFFSLFNFLLLALLHKSILNFSSHPKFPPKLLSESIVPLFLTNAFPDCMSFFLFYFLPFPFIFLSISPWLLL